MEAWAQGVFTLPIIANPYPQSEYYGLGVSLQIQWQYLQRAVSGVGSLMCPIEDSLKEAFFPTLLVAEEVSSDLR